MPKKIKRIHQMTIKEWETAFPTEDACADYLIRHRWPLGIRCPRCGAEVTHSVSTMPYKWQCYTCAPGSGYRFSHIAGTVFENTNKPLRDWFRVLHMMLTSKKGVSALQVHRTLGFGSYRTAWYMCHRLRGALANEEFRKLVGVVEVDETYIGGRGENRHGPHKGEDKGRSLKRKSAIIGAVERKGNVVARMINRVDHKTVMRFIDETISHKVELVAHDDFKSYRAIRKQIPHGAVNHSKGQIRSRHHSHQHHRRLLVAD